MMTLQEALDYLNNYGWSQWKLGLERTEELLRRVGNPEKDLKFLHVAGTNGKGSTCAMLAQILQEAGYRIGFYPSPFIEDFRERIQVNGEFIREEAFCRITEVVKEAAEAMEEHPTHFELITAVGMLYFKEMQCDLAILEVGLGGTFDSTNVIDAPVAAILTNIGLDHTEYLGDTLPKIASQKAGIIKPGSAVISYDNEPEVMAVFREFCEKAGDPLYEAKKTDVTPLSPDLDGQVFAWKGQEYRLALIGRNQLNNVTTVLKTVEVLREKGYDISDEALKAGLEKVRWMARFEVLQKDPVFILDGGHNPQCAEALVENVRDYLPGQVAFIAGMLADKDYQTTLDIVKPYGASFFTLTPDSPRALSAEDLARVLREKGAEAEACASPEEAISKALAKGLPVVAFGSLYMAGALRMTWRKMSQSRKDRT